MGVLHRLISRLTYANVTATLALFIALGGASYAVTELPAHSVGTRQLKAGAVTPGALGFLLGAHAFRTADPVVLERAPCYPPVPGPSACDAEAFGGPRIPLGVIRLRDKATVALTGIVELVNNGPADSNASVTVGAFCGEDTSPQSAGPTQHVVIPAGGTATISVQSVANVRGPLAKGTTAVRNVGIEYTRVKFSTRDPAQLVMQNASVDATILPG